MASKLTPVSTAVLWTAAANFVMFTIVAAVFATHDLGLRTPPTSQAASNA